MANTPRYVDLPGGVPGEIHAVLDSTNAEARRRIAKGDARDLWIAAAEQTGGRGRRGRAWISEAGNLFASRIVKPGCPPARAAELSFVAALAVRDAVVATLPATAPPVTCKWPNDILIARQKVSGMLLEAEGFSGWVVIGIGINVKAAPEGVEFPATSLAAHGATAGAEAVLAALAAAFEERFMTWKRDGFAPIRMAWRTAASGLGETIRVRLEAREFEGIFRDIDDSGALLVERADGAVERVAAGDVFFA